MKGTVKNLFFFFNSQESEVESHRRSLIEYKGDGEAFVEYVTFKLEG